MGVELVLICVKRRKQATIPTSVTERNRDVSLAKCSEARPPHGVTPSYTAACQGGPELTGPVH